MRNNRANEFHLLRSHLAILSLNRLPQGPLPPFLGAAWGRSMDPLYAVPHSPNENLGWFQRRCVMSEGKAWNALPRSLKHCRSKRIRAAPRLSLSGRNNNVSTSGGKKTLGAWRHSCIFKWLVIYAFWKFSLLFHLINYKTFNGWFHDHLDVYKMNYKVWEIQYTLGGAFLKHHNWNKNQAICFFSHFKKRSNA